MSAGSLRLRVRASSAQPVRSMASWLGRLDSLALRTRSRFSGAGGELRRLAGLIALLQLVGIAAAVSTLIMLHGDGSFFVYALGAGSAWELKWQFIPARVAVYLLTVLPTAWVSEWARLAPLEIARLNGFVFYFVPLVQYLSACALVWRRQAWLLCFPIATFVFGSALGFGYPSEILLSPGFLWLALFALHRWSVFHPLFSLGVSGLLLSHEASAAAAIVAVRIAYVRATAAGRTTRVTDRLRLWLILLSPFAALFAIRALGGGAGSDHNAIYVVDPRRVFNNPSLWLVSLGLLAAVVGRRWIRGRYATAVAFGMGLGVPLVVRYLAPTTDFEQGRYDSARSVIALTMLVAALLFGRLTHPGSESLAKGPSETAHRRERAPVMGALYLALGIAVGCSWCFVGAWWRSLSTFRTSVSCAHAGCASAPEFVSFDQFIKQLEPADRLLAEQMDFHWVLLYRSAVLGNGALPARFVYRAGEAHHYCDLAGYIEPERSRFSSAVLGRLSQFACAQPPRPPGATLGHRILARLRRLASL